MEAAPRRFSALVFGASGAVGSEVTKQLLANALWNPVYLVVRSLTPALNALAANPNVRLVVCPEVVNPVTLTEALKDAKIDAVFNFLGSQTKHGKEAFIHVDKTLVVQSAEFALSLKANHFVHVTSMGADANSMFLYMKTKGQCENELQKIPIENVVVYRPGLLVDRKDARFVEKIGSWVPFLNKIKTEDLAKRIAAKTLADLQTSQKAGFKIIPHSEITKIRV